MSDQDMPCGVDARPWWQQALHGCQPEALERRLFHALGDHTVGGSAVPISWASGEWRYHGKGHADGLAARFCDDAAFVGLWAPGSEQMSLVVRRECLRGFIAWYLWQWLGAEWGGLRRRLWYWLLFRSCARQARWAAAMRETGQYPSEVKQHA